MSSGEPIEGLDELLKKLRKLQALKPITSALKLVGAHVMGFMKQYPANRYFVRQARKFKTEKQRRYFFWALKQGKIEVPYRRGKSPGSRNLKQQWKLVTENPLRVVVENNTPYVGWVQSAKQQAFYHKEGGWLTDEDAVKDAQPLMIREVKGAIERTLAGADGGE